MTPYEWAEVFGAAADSYARSGNALVNVFAAMEKKCQEIADRGRVKEDMFMGKPISELTYQEAIRFREYLWESQRWVPEGVLDTMFQIIARGES